MQSNIKITTIGKLTLTSPYISASNYNFDNIIITGQYYISLSSGTSSNAPIGGAFDWTLIVIGNDSAIIYQEATYRNASNQIKKYVRRYNGATWNAWIDIYNEINYPTTITTLNSWNTTLLNVSSYYNTLFLNNKKLTVFNYRNLNLSLSNGEKTKLITNYNEYTPLASGDIQTLISDLNCLYIAYYNNGDIYRLNKNTLVSDSLSHGAIGIGDMCFDGRYLYCGSKFGWNYSIMKIDTITWALITTVNIGRSTNSICFDGTYIYSGYYANANIIRIPISNFSVGAIQTLTFGSGNGVAAHSMAFDGRYIYFGIYGNTYMHKIDTTNFTLGGYSYYNYNIAIGNSSCFDGKYIYFIGINESGYYTLNKFDTTASLDGSGFSTLLTVGVGQLLGCCAFDGRYVYISWYNGSTAWSIKKWDTTTETLNTNFYSSAGSIPQINPILCDNKFVYFGFGNIGGGKIVQCISI